MPRGSLQPSKRVDSRCITGLSGIAARAMQSRERAIVSAPVSLGLDGVIFLASKWNEYINDKVLVDENRRIWLSRKHDSRRIPIVHASQG